MSVIKAYKSDSDGIIFEFYADYQKHLRKLAAARRKEKKQAEQKARRDAVINKMRTECSTIDELRDYLIEHWDEMIAEKVKLNGINFSSMRWYDSVSNSHSCPISGVTNWWGKPDLPKGYPGWIGRIHIQVTGKLLDQSFVLSKLGIHVGTGGGGSYEVNLFADDFPGLTRDIVWEKLKK